MKILKRPEHLVFDTDNPEQWHVDTGINHRELTLLHNTHATSDWKFLALYFDPEHIIFDNFSTSYYYLIPDAENPTTNGTRH